MLFKRHLLDKILSGEKTQTRRSTERKKGVRVYEVGERVGVRVGYTPFAAYVLIKDRRKQAISDITEDDARKEGFVSVEEFKETWIKLYGKWDPNQVVWVYDFVLDKQDSPSKDSSAEPEAGLSKSR